MNNPQQQKLSEEEKRIRRLASKKKWRDKNKSHQSALSRAWAEKNKDRIRSLARLRYAKNIEESRNRLKRKRDKNRAKFNAWSREWKRKQGDKYKAKRIVYESKRRATAGCNSPLVDEWIFKIKNQEIVPCYYCGTVQSGAKIHIEHMTPISRGGKHELQNLCASCSSCNLKKATKTAEEWKSLNPAAN